MAKRKYKMKMKMKKGGENDVQSNIDNTIKIADLAQKERAAQVQEELVDQEIATQKLNRFRTIVDTITKPFRILGNLIVRFVVYLVDKISILLAFIVNKISTVLSIAVDSRYPISNYIALILAILFVIIIIVIILDKRGNNLNQRSSNSDCNKSNNYLYNKITGVFKWIYDAITGFFKFLYDLLFPSFLKNLFTNIKNLFTPSYKTKLMIMGTKNEKINEIPREEINGRCDNMEYYEMGNKDNGLCIKTLKPNELQWNINIANNKELSSGIPSDIVSKISNQGKKFVVKIPWKESGMEFVPDCNNMKYMDGTKADLLIDNGNVCKMVEKEQKEYNELGRYPSNSDKYKGLDQFITENNPICN